MTEFDQLTVVQEACNRVTNAFNPGNKITKGMIKVLVMDDSLLCDMGMTKQMITNGTGNYYAYIKIFNGNTLIKYLIAANSPKKQ